MYVHPHNYSQISAWEQKCTFLHFIDTIYRMKYTHGSWSFVLVFCRVRYREILPIFINSLAPGKFEINFRHVISKQILVIDGWGNSCDIALIWMSLDFTDDQSTLVQLMAWWRQATRHYLRQCWPKYMPPYDVTRPQRVKAAALAPGNHTIAPMPEKQPSP